MRIIEKGEGDLFGNVVERRTNATQPRRNALRCCVAQTNVVEGPLDASFVFAFAFVHLRFCTSEKPCDVVAYMYHPNRANRRSRLGGLR